MKRRGVIVMELMLAIAVFILGISSLGAVLFHQMRLTKATYRKQTVLNLLDREMLKLQAGDWRTHAPGTERPYNIPGLPGGTATLEIKPHASIAGLKEMKLTWQSDPSTGLQPLILTGLVFSGEREDE